VDQNNYRIIELAMWQITALIFSILIFIALARVFLVKTIFDKLVVLDVANTLVIALLITLSIIWKEVILADIAIVYALLSLIGILYFTKYVE